MFPGHKALRFHKTDWLPSPCSPVVSSIQLPLPLGLLLLFLFQEFVFYCSPQLSCLCWWWWSWLMPFSFAVILIECLEGAGWNGWLSVGRNFLIVSYVNSFRLSSSQYYFRYSAWRQSCDWGFSQKGMLSSPFKLTNPQLVMCCTQPSSGYSRVCAGCFTNCQVYGWDLRGKEELRVNKEKRYLIQELCQRK